MTEYITANTPIPPFLPYPRFMLKMDVSQTCLFELSVFRGSLSLLDLLGTQLL